MRRRTEIRKDLIWGELGLSYNDRAISQNFAAQYKPEETHFRIVNCIDVNYQDWSNWLNIKRNSLFIYACNAYLSALAQLAWDKTTTKRKRKYYENAKVLINGNQFKVCNLSKSSELLYFYG